MIDSVKSSSENNDGFKYIETELNRRMEYDVDYYREIRVAVTDNRLYYWHVDNSPDRWLNVLADQKFYIAKEDKLRLIDETIKHLHVRGVEKPPSTI